MAKLRKSVLTNRAGPGLRTIYNTPPKQDDAARVYRVTDITGQTKKATSNEKFIADALTKFNLAFQFQMSVGGGRSQSFGIVLDFLVMTRPMPTPLWVHGEFWHQGAQRAADLRAMVTVDTFGQGNYARGVEIWGNESDEPEKAMNAVRRKIL